MGTRLIPIFLGVDERLLDIAVIVSLEQTTGVFQSK